ncbi:MAG TPA: adenosylcobalamin-dependent ribonucleoside-diphosphate reductase [Thermomicrobiales bacterium]|nr:adenosylcobalamin-dependent ribonucleoside-diphosphate reductase [Thermomicrobiales bacterium]
MTSTGTNLTESGASGADGSRGTTLTGVRAKVFLDRYSLKDPSGAAIESTPEELWRRVARGIAAVEPTEELRRVWEERFYDALTAFKFVPGGRILAGAGSGHAVTYYNCFQGDTPVHTREGIVPIGSLSGVHDVLSEGGVYRPALFQSYGHQRLWAVTLSNGVVFHATGDHQWVATSPKGGTERVPTRDLKARRIPINARPAPARDADFAEGVRHGVVFGDGSTQYGKAHVCLFGESEQLAPWFDAYGARPAGGTVATKAHLRVQGLPATWKQLPRSDVSPSYWRGFVAGLIAADGHVNARGSVALYNKDTAVLTRIAEGMAAAGFVASGITMTRETSPYDGSAKPVYRLQLFKATVTADDLLLPSHRANFEASPRARQATIQVIDVRETDRVEEVFCCVEPETHTITVGHGYLTGQCYVIPSPEDSRGGILDNLKVMTEIMARGGGVGINLSTLRPRGSYIRTVNGTASGPCSWAELYSVATGDVIQQGGSRRGALMLMLDDDHPDVEEFIAAKRIDPLTNRPVAIEHANISVAVSDAFMQAVKDDGDWQLQFPTRAQVKAHPELAGQVQLGRVVKARDVWAKICASAWATAEPGVVFMDRYNTRSNTWYYENIRCVNPCGEQGLPEWGVCNLGALNLAAFVHGPTGAGELDYAALAEHARVAMRFLDNVVDANLYFIEENREAQLGTRRTGLGTMGLADALIGLGVRYGSDESLAVVDRIYRTIRDAAYDMSADIAAEKGAFGHFDREQYLQGEFIRELPAAIQEKIARQGIRNAVLLTQAPTGTTSLLAGVSSGIEPVFDFAMVRRDRTGEHVMYHPLLQAWKDAHPDAPTPGYFVGANDLTPEDHVRVQAAVQQYTDSSISKTVNAPNHHTAAEVDRLYRLAYDLGCKGVTYYRDGSRDAVLTHLEEPKEAPQPEPAPALPATVRARPPVLHGYTRNIKAPEGTVNITVNSDEEGPLEVFINVGRGGSDVSALAEALGRLISLALRIPSPMAQDDRLREMASQLRGIGGSRTIGFGPEQVRSLPDAVGKALDEHLDGLPALQPPPMQLPLPTAADADAPDASHARAGKNGHSQADPHHAAYRMTGNLCPECGSTTLVYQEGCKKCLSCGYSEC